MNFKQFLEEKTWIAKLKEKYSLLKLNVYEFENKISIDLIIVNSKNQGTGTKVIQEICDYADKNNKIIICSPSEDFGSNKKRLINFYKKFGFVENKGTNKDYNIFETMYRLPEVNEIAIKGKPVAKEEFNEEDHLDADGDIYLTSRGLYELPDMPEVCEKSVFVSDNNLKDLVGCPKIVKGDFGCSKNMLESLKGCPKEVHGDFMCWNQKNGKVFTELEIREVCDVTGRVAVKSE